MTDNPLLRDAELPPFDEIRPEHIEPAIDHLLTACRDTLETVVASGPPWRWDEVVAPLDAVHDRLSRAWSPVQHLNAVVSEDALRAAYNACLPKLSAYHAELAQDERLYRAYQALREEASLDDAQRKVLDDALRSFRLGGVALEGEARERFRANASRLSELGAQFEQQLLDATNAWTKVVPESVLDGLPESARALARQAARRAAEDGDTRIGDGDCLITLEAPSLLAVLLHAHDRDLRREAYEAHVTRASDQGPHAGQYDNTAVMEEMLALRQEQAELLGYPHYAAKALEKRMARSADEVQVFLKDLAGRARPRAQAEYDELEAFARERDGLDGLAAWDVPYYGERLREARFELTDEDLRPYFPADHAIDGLFQVASRLFGVTFERDDGVETWHADAAYYRIFDSEGRVRGGLYTDLYARPRKRGGAWMAECRVRRRTADGVQQPVAFLTCNFTPPVDGEPALLTHDEVVTLFHEFGHTLHHLLTRQDYASIAGIHGVEWDAVELPSQLLENWCWEREALDLFARHHQRGEPIPEALFQRLQAARHFQAGMKMVRQLEFSLFDLALHTQVPTPDAAGIQATLDRVRDQVAVLRPPAFNRFQHSFAHIFAGGYAAGYYSYKWAEVLSADAWSRFEQEGVFNRETGRSLASCILEQGGSQPARELFRAFRGRDPEIEPLLRQSGLAA